MNLVYVRGGKEEFLRRIERIWNRRGDVPAFGKIVAKVMKVKICEGCLDPFVKADPRTRHCSHQCSQQHRRFNERLAKDAA